MKVSYDGVTGTIHGFMECWLVNVGHPDSGEWQDLSSHPHLLPLVWLRTVDTLILNTQVSRGQTRKQV